MSGAPYEASDSPYGHHTRFIPAQFPVPSPHSQHHVHNAPATSEHGRSPSPSFPEPGTTAFYAHQPPQAPTAPHSTATHFPRVPLSGPGVPYPHRATNSYSTYGMAPGPPTYEFSYPRRRQPAPVAAHPTSAAMRNYGPDYPAPPPPVPLPRQILVASQPQVDREPLDVPEADTEPAAKKKKSRRVEFSADNLFTIVKAAHEISLFDVTRGQKGLKEAQFGERCRAAGLEGSNKLLLSRLDELLLWQEDPGLPQLEDLDKRITKSGLAPSFGGPLDSLHQSRLSMSTKTDSERAKAIKKQEEDKVAGIAIRAAAVARSRKTQVSKDVPRASSKGGGVSATPATPAPSRATRPVATPVTAPGLPSPPATAVRAVDTHHPSPPPANFRPLNFYGLDESDSDTPPTPLVPKRERSPSVIDISSSPIRGRSMPPSLVIPKREPSVINIPSSPIAPVKAEPLDDATNTPRKATSSKRKASDAVLADDEASPKKKKTSPLKKKSRKTKRRRREVESSGPLDFAQYMKKQEERWAIADQRWEQQVANQERMLDSIEAGNRMYQKNSEQSTEVQRDLVNAIIGLGGGANRG